MSRPGSCSRPRSLAASSIPASCRSTGWAYADGRPYYAMRFIRGDSLKEAIDRFHARGLQDRPGPPVAGAAQAAGRFTDVCNAVDYAHTRGVLHRDLSRATSCWASTARPWSSTGAWPRRSAGPPAAGERTLMPSSAAARPRRCRAARGNPGVHEPRAGRRRPGRWTADRRVQPGRDPYCLLTGRPPFEGEVGEILCSRAAGRVPAAAQMIPRIDRALEAVCLKAMALRPEDRYASPRALAEDVERWMADEPVSAWREPWTRRLARWARRHRTFMGIAATLLLAVGTLGPAAFVRERQLRGRAQAASMRAGELARVAQEAVDLTVETVVIDQGELLEAVPVSTRKNVAQQVLPYYDQIVALQGDDVAARAGAAKTLLNRAKLKHTVGTTEDDEGAVADCLQSAELYAAAAPTAQNAAGRARALVSLGAILGPQRRFQEAITHLNQARLILDPLVAAQPDRADERFSLALCLSNEANCHRYLGEEIDTRGRHRRCRAASIGPPSTPMPWPSTMWSGWLNKRPERLGTANGCPGSGETWANFIRHGATRTKPRSLVAAGQALLNARQIALELDHEQRNATLIQDCLATACLNYGDYLRGNGRPAEAIAEFDRARVVYNQLNDRHPDEREFRWGQALALSSLGIVHREAKSTGPARTTLEEAARHYDPFSRHDVQFKIVIDKVRPAPKNYKVCHLAIETDVVV